MIDASTSGQFDPVGSVLHHPKIRAIINKVLLMLNVSQAELEKTLVENLSHFGKNLLGGLTGGLGNVASAITDFIFMILSTFFFLEGGSEFVEGINKYIPFSKKQRDRLLK
ncbi:MAG TPA: hypothetical protein DCZ04_05390, partial [Syntrophorhabdus aromaticivorans]|nr:hypothetical protein [Syntrophorhabdus aromaticivorans]